MFTGKTENFGRLTAEAGYSCQNRNPKFGFLFFKKRG